MRADLRAGLILGVVELPGLCRHAGTLALMASVTWHHVRSLDFAASRGLAAA